MVVRIGEASHPGPFPPAPQVQGNGSAQPACGSFRRGAFQRKGPTLANPVLAIRQFWPIWADLLCGGAPKGGGPKRFFSSLFSLFLSEFWWWVFEGLGPLGLSCETPAAPKPATKRVRERGRGSKGRGSTVAPRRPPVGPSPGRTALSWIAHDHTTGACVPSQPSWVDGGGWLQRR